MTIMSLIAGLLIIKFCWMICLIAMGEHEDTGGPVSGWGTPED
jgi:hypothetical protein